MPIKEIKPNPGPQTLLCSSLADIRVFGGGAGGGKSYIIMLDPLRYIRTPLVDAITFRRTSPQLTQAGGLWEKACELYLPLGGKPRQSPSLEFRFNRGFTHRFGHLQHEKDVFTHQGAAYTIINLDEATHFTKKQFWYLRSRLRGMSGVRPYMNLTCNPDPDWWGLELISWFLDDEGYPIPERAGVLRWFIRRDDALVWGDSKEELIERYPNDGKFAISVTFIPSKLTDNPQLLAADPGYQANINSMCLVDRLRLGGGNWKIREAAGNMFRRGWFPIVDASPANATRIRYWDRAGTEDPELVSQKSADGGPDYTAGVRLSRSPEGIFYVEHVHQFRGTPGDVQRAVKNIASQDGDGVVVGIEQDPGQAGKAEAGFHVTNLAGYDVRTYPVSGKGKKIVRAKPASAQAEHGNIRIVRGAWNEAFLRELEQFPSKKFHDDQVDALSGALNALCEMESSGMGVG